MSSLGLLIKAIAIITRCRIPPDNWCGYSPTRISGEGIFTRFNISTACRRASRLPTFWWINTASTSCRPTVCTGLSAVIGSWKIIPISPPLMRCSSSSSTFSRSFPVKTHLSRQNLAHGLRQQMDQAQGRDTFPATGLSDDSQRLATVDGEIHIIHGNQQAGIRFKPGFQIPHIEQRFCYFLSHFSVAISPGIGRKLPDSPEIPPPCVWPPGFLPSHPHPPSGRALQAVHNSLSR